mmetsp:Transcript_573/g.1381  ORF Transcript_573/g.1381 Transcript_573/m.1381 type:complete len:284 (-) Transcript_573:372-1223(-)
MPSMAAIEQMIGHGLHERREQPALKSQRTVSRRDGWGSGDALRRRERRNTDRCYNELPRYPSKQLQTDGQRTSVAAPAPPASKSQTAVPATMTPAQEIANALTMLLPLGMALNSFMEEQPAPGELLVASAIILHFPFSFCYHISCALLHGRVHPVEDNLGLKLDLAFIHIAGSIMSLGTSGSLAWFAANAAFNSVAVYRTGKWCNTAVERQLCRLLCVLGYLNPMLWHDSALFLNAVSVFFAMAACFVCNKWLSGWGHALSHVLLAPFASFVFAAARLAPLVL